MDIAFPFLLGPTIHALWRLICRCLILKCPRDGQKGKIASLAILGKLLEDLETELKRKENGFISMLYSRNICGLQMYANSNLFELKLTGNMKLKTCNLCGLGMLLK